MDRSVEHVLLRLLTPAFLLFLAAHIAAGVLEDRAAREPLAGSRYVTLFLDDDSGAAKMMRPNKVQPRKPRIFEQQPEEPKPRFLEVAAAYVAAFLGQEETQQQSVRAVSQVAVPPLFAHARARNPRDPPMPAS
jgi:hypothetical protein